MAKIGINGFGRTGKLLLKAILERHPTKLTPCAINDPAMETPKYAAYIFKYDSVHGRFYGSVCSDEKHIIVNGIKIPVYKEKEPKKVPWGQCGVEYVAECSGKYLSVAQAKQHIAGSVKKVVISAPSPDAPTFVLGVNHCSYTPKDMVVSMSSCTTTALAPLCKIIHEKFGLKEGFYTVVHSATPYQKLLDGFSTRSYRIGRCAMLNIIPAVSGAAEAIGKIIPDLNGKVTGLALRVPVPVSAVIDLTVRTCKGGTLVDINDTLKDAAQCSLSGILCYTDEELVSTDITGCNCSLVYDASAGMQLGDKFFKLLAWYDNEYGYSCRLADFLSYMHERDIEAECEKNNDKNKPKAENKPC